MPRFRTLALLVGLACLFTGADQFIKRLIIHALAPVGEYPVIPGVLQLVYRENTGAAFSLFHDAPMAAIIALNVVVVVLFGWIIWPYLQHWSGSVTAGLVLGGAAGNLLDRIFRHYVVDYLDIRYHGATVWPIFNLADICVVTGAGLLLLLLGISMWKEHATPTPTPPVDSAPTPEGPTS